MNTNYSLLLSDLIDKSGLSLTEISLRAEKHGQKITTSYLSKLKNGKMPPPSFKMSIALALTLEVDPELLLAAGVLDNNETNKEELQKSLEELYPEMENDEMLEKVWTLALTPHNIVNPNKDMPTAEEYQEYLDDVFSQNEKDLIKERDLSLESLKGKFNLEIDGKPATDEEIEEMIKHVKLLRIMKQMEGS